MIEWREAGILLRARPHGESSAIIDVLTRTHGRYAGVVRGGASRRLAPVLQPGAQLDLTWRARIEAHIGSFKIEPIRTRTGAMQGRLPLAGLRAVSALLLFCLPERQSDAALYDRSERLLDMLEDTETWPSAYLQWERALLDSTGYGLDLSACAVTGARTDLAYVSPRTGRAVSRKGAGEWAPHLFPLPGALMDAPRHATTSDILSGLEITGHFLKIHLATDLGQNDLPQARAWLIKQIRACCRACS